MNGRPATLGQTINAPLPPQTGDEGILYTMENLVMPILEEWKPTTLSRRGSG